MKATHYYPDDTSFYESWYIVEEDKIVYYKIYGDVWKEPNPENKYERFPDVESLQEIG